MKIIISPTKKMTIETDSFLAESEPQFLVETQCILDKLQVLSYEAAKQLWKCNDSIATENFERLKTMRLDKQLSPAVMSYKGLQFQYMAPDLFTEPALEYIKKHLYIVSGFYGLLRSFDGISPYRLEMQANLSVDGSKNLYDYWGDKLYQALKFDKGPVINLASKEYTKAIAPFLQTGDQLIEIVFATRGVDGKLKIKATPAKIARGQMVRYMAEHNVQDLESLKLFDHPHFQFSTEYSNDQQFVYLQV